MTIEELRKKKDELGLTSEMISERSGVPLSTVQKIFAGVTNRPRIETRLRIERVFLKESADRYCFNDIDIDSSYVRESNLAELYGNVEKADAAIEMHSMQHIFMPPGNYTIDDYYRESVDKRMELINGYLYDLSAPTSKHQIVVSLIGKVLLDYAEGHDFRCMPYQSPVDVRLNRDNKTMLQPDLFVICENDAVDNGRYIEGAPDLVIEVLSPSTLSRDLTVKRDAYFRTGVREYWVIDPDNNIIDVFDFENFTMFERYTFDDIVPIGISGGELKIDFPRIRAIIEKRQSAASADKEAE